MSTNRKSPQAKAAKAEAEEYTGPITFKYKGEEYTTKSSGNSPEMYHVSELLQEERVLPALKYLLDQESYVKYRETNPKVSDAYDMIRAWGEVAGERAGESQG